MFYGTFDIILFDISIFFYTFFLTLLPDKLNCLLFCFLVMTLKRNEMLKYIHTSFKIKVLLLQIMQPL